MPLTALLDGDMYAYRCAVSCEKRDKEGNIVSLEPLEIALLRLEGMVRDTLIETNAQTYKVFLSPKYTFRHLINPQYKSNRTQPRPEHLTACKEYLIEHHGAETGQGIEADDLLGINQNEGTVICSNDKDLLMIPGYHYNPIKNEAVDQTELGGYRHFYSQMLIGDKADNIIGVKGIGPVKASKLLDGYNHITDLDSVVYNLYNDDKRFFINGACLWILQDKGGIWYVNELLDLLENEVDLKKKLLTFLETGQLTSPTSSDTQSQPVSTTTNQTGN